MLNFYNNTLNTNYNNTSKNKFLAIGNNDSPLITFKKMKKHSNKAKAADKDKLSLNSTVKITNSKEYKNNNSNYYNNTSLPDLFLSNVTTNKDFYKNKNIGHKHHKSTISSFISSNNLQGQINENIILQNKSQNLSPLIKKNIKILNFKKPDKSNRSEQSSDKLHIQNLEYKGPIKTSVNLNSSRSFISPSNRFNNLNPSSNAHAYNNAINYNINPLSTNNNYNNNYNNKSEYYYLSFNSINTGVNTFFNKKLQTRLNFWPSNNNGMNDNNSNNNNNIRTHHDKLKLNKSPPLEPSYQVSSFLNFYKANKQPGRNKSSNFNIPDYSLTSKNLDGMHIDERINKQDSFSLFSKKIDNIKAKKFQGKIIQMTDFDQFEDYKEKYFKNREEQLYQDAAYFIINKINKKKQKKYIFKEVSLNQHFPRIVDKISRLVEIKNKNNEVVSVEYIANMLREEIESEEIQNLSTSVRGQGLPRLHKEKNKSKNSFASRGNNNEFNEYGKKQMNNNEHSSHLIKDSLKIKDFKGDQPDSFNDEEHSLSKYSGLNDSFKNVKYKKTHKPPHTGDFTRKTLGDLGDINITNTKFLNTQKNFFMKKLDSLLITQSSGFSALDDQVLRKTLSILNQQNKKNKNVDKKKKNCENGDKENRDKNLILPGTKNTVLPTLNEVSNKTKATISPTRSKLIKKSNDNTTNIRKKRLKLKDLKKLKIEVTASEAPINNENNTNTNKNLTLENNKLTSEDNNEIFDNLTSIRHTVAENEKSITGNRDDDIHYSNHVMNSENINTLTARKTICNSSSRHMETNSQPRKKIKIKKQKINESDSSEYEEVEVLDAEDPDAQLEATEQIQQTIEIPNVEDVETVAINNFKKFMMENILGNTVNDKTLKWLEDMNGKEKEEDEEFTYVNGKRFSYTLFQINNFFYYFLFISNS